MKLKNATCPKCDSTNTHKEKILGSDTTDIECLDCKYVGHWKEFQKEESI